MTNEDFIRLARAAGVPLDFTLCRNGPVGSFTMQEFITMMKAAYSAGQLAEREACARQIRAEFERWARDEFYNGMAWHAQAKRGMNIEVCTTMQHITWHLRHGEQPKPEVGGYYVVYEDGYKSFSPASAFESGYTPL